MDTSAQDQPQMQSSTQPLTYEETPIIEPIKAETSSVPALKGSGFLGFLGNFIFFAIMFGVGVWLSTFLRQFVSPTVEEVVPTPTPEISTPSAEIQPFANWKTYQVVSGLTRQAIANLSFKLPPDVLSPTCDGNSCASQGTYLPGETRFTVAARGSAQVLGFLPGAVITDVAGRPFTTKPTTVAGRPALEYTGDFRGSTVGGYTFTKMRGVMIEVSDSLTLEMNHFAPNGVASDFASDDRLFDEILKTLEFPTATSLPSATSTPLKNF